MNFLVCGDSFTYGEELPNTNGAWPYHCGLNNVSNHAGSGYSNDAIVSTTVASVYNKNKYAGEKPDGVIVAWTTPNRIDVNGQHLTPSSHRKYGSICDHVFLDWDERWASNKFKTQVVLLDSFLRDRQIPYLFVRTFDVPEFEIGNWAPGSMVEWMGDCPKGPGGHPLELGHQRIAEKINEHIRNLGWLS